MNTSTQDNWKAMWSEFDPELDYWSDLSIDYVFAHEPELDGPSEWAVTITACWELAFLMGRRGDSDEQVAARIGQAVLQSHHRIDHLGTAQFLRAVQHGWRTGQAVIGLDPDNEWALACEMVGG